MIARISSMLSQQGIGRVLYYMIQRIFQLGRLVIVTPINLYYTGPVATFLWIKMQNFRNIYLYPFFSSSNPFLNKFRIRTCSICWSCDPKHNSNLACTYLRVLFLVCSGRRRGDSIEMNASKPNKYICHIPFPFSYSLLDFSPKDWRWNMIKFSIMRK